MKLQAPIPLFRIFDHQIAKAFYCDWLGFAIDWEHQFNATGPRYIQISRDSAIFHLTEHYGDCTPGSKAFLLIDDVAALHAELHSRPNPNMNPGIEDAPWGDKILQITDPFGNRICFNQSTDK